MRTEDGHVRGGVHTPQPLRIPTGQALCAAHIETGTNLTPLFFMFLRRKFFGLGILSTVKHQYGLLSRALIFHCMKNILTSVILKVSQLLS